jgi:hypothetical protein
MIFSNFFGKKPTPERSGKIPFTTFNGWLKCHRPEFSNEIQLAAMQAAFPKFLTRDSMSNEEMTRLQKMAEQKLDAYFWTGRPPRRYAGDLVDDFSMPRGSYYTVCQNERGEDTQTLANEMMAYRDPTVSGEIYALDLSEPRYAGGDKTHQAVSVVFRSRPHLYNPFLSTLAKIQGKPISALLDENVAVWIPYLVERKIIDDVIDLRLPNVRNWFVDTFAEGDGQVLFKQLISDRREEVTFKRMLPTLMYPTLGGNKTTHAIGQWMRLNNVNAFIFPSARCDVHVTVRNGQLVDEGCWGWNLIDYRNAPPQKRSAQFVDISDWEQVGPMDAIGHAEPGSEYDGSLTVDGVVARRFNNDAKDVEKFYARKFIVHPSGMDIGPVDLEFIRDKLAKGHIADTTGVTANDEHLPVLCPGFVSRLFAFPDKKS